MSRKNDVAIRAQVERESLQHIRNALNRIIEWEERGGDPSQKLPSLRLIALAFRRHLDGLIAVEEQGGYLQEVTEARPQLSGEVASLQREFEDFQALIDRIVARLQQVAPTNRARMLVVSEELFALANELEEHDRKEIDLLQEAFLRVEGGEG